ncbi:hypothetical protein VTK26DRAFT_3866 [Humicola hyalothermophila]
MDCLVVIDAMLWSTWEVFAERPENERYGKKAWFKWTFPTGMTPGGSSDTCRAVLWEKTATGLPTCKTCCRAGEAQSAAWKYNQHRTALWRDKVELLSNIAAVCCRHCPSRGDDVRTEAAGICSRQGHSSSFTGNLGCPAAARAGLLHASVQIHRFELVSFGAWTTGKIRVSTAGPNGDGGELYPREMSAKSKITWHETASQRGAA